MRFFTSLFFCFALVVSGSAQLTVLELLAAAPSNSHFNDIVSNDDLNALLDSETDLTVLVPNNDAIDAYAAAMGMTTADFIASESAVDMALYHIVPNEAIMFSALSGESVVTTALGMPISFQEYEVVNATDVAAADLEVSNGVVHLLDEVVVLSDGIYQWLDASTQHNYLTTAVNFLGLDGAFSAIGAGTIFAPTDQAILTYADANDLSIIDIVYNPDFLDALLVHSVGSAALTSGDLLAAGNVTADSGDELFITSSEGAVYVNAAEVTNADNLTQNGVVHVVNEIIMPTNFLSDAIADAGLTLLDTLLTLTGIIDELSVPANYTVFAPTDSAIMAFLEAEELTLDELLLDVDGLTEGLLLHVVDDLLESTDLQDGDQLMTLAGDAVLVEVAEGSVMVGGATVVQADILADNGILHLMGAVLTPYIEGCTDEDACNYDDDATVDDGSCYELEVTTSTVDNVCVDGEDGIIYVDVANAPDAILLGDYQGQQVFETEDGVFSGLLSGTYVIHVEDTAGCTTSVAVEINDPTSSALTLSVSSTPDDGSESGTITALPSGGVPPYTVDIYDADGNEVADAYLPAGDYFVKVQDDLGCSVTVLVTVESSVTIVDVDGASMVLYPNPTRGTIEITNLPARWTSLHVMNVAGCEMLAMQPLATGSLQWDASDWPVGVYFVQVVGQDGLFTKRFSVVR
ncbi:MAG: fasciclin domain-containing protein [Bacteroidota bacterium]|nr:fasciclin domain-containing protein [Bacteroidota bacterium]